MADATGKRDGRIGTSTAATVSAQAPVNWGTEKPALDATDDAANSARTKGSDSTYRRQRATQIPSDIASRRQWDAARAIIRPGLEWWVGLPFDRQPREPRARRPRSTDRSAPTHKSTVGDHLLQDWQDGLDNRRRVEEFDDQGKVDQHAQDIGGPRLAALARSGDAAKDGDLLEPVLVVQESQNLVDQALVPPLLGLGQIDFERL